MFELIDIEDHIPLPAQTFPKDFAAFPFSSTSSAEADDESSSLKTSSSTKSIEVLAETRSRFRQALLSAIGAKLLFRVVPDAGLVVSIASLLHVADDVHLLPGQANVWVHCHFTVVVFNPTVGSRLRAKIVEQSRDMGIRLSVEFFDQIFVPPSCLVEGSEWEPAIQQWGIRDASGTFIRYVNNTTHLNTTNNQQQQNANSPQIDKNNKKPSMVTEDDADCAAEGRSPIAVDPTYSSPSAATSGFSNENNNNQFQQQQPQQQPPGSVICVVDQVSIISNSQNNNNNHNNTNNENPDSFSATEFLPSATAAMKIFANFTVCDGLGPEAWFEENA